MNETRPAGVASDSSSSGWIALKPGIVAQGALYGLESSLMSLPPVSTAPSVVKSFVDIVEAAAAVAAAAAEAAAAAAAVAAAAAAAAVAL